MILGRVMDRDKWIFYGFITITMGTALVLSASRGGIMSLFIQLVSLPILAQLGRSQSKYPYAEPVPYPDTVQLVPMKRGADQSTPPPLSQTQRELWRFMGGAMLLAVCIVVGVVWIGAEPVVSRLSLSDQTGQSRPIVQQHRPATWWNTVKMIRAHPLTGAGLGAYPTVYPHYDDSTGYFLVDAAHNDYLQVLADMGLIGGLLGVIFLVLLLKLIGDALSSPEPLERAVGLGCTVGCIGILAHSLVDFNLQITANALIFLILVALLNTVQWRAIQAESGELIYAPR
jgi:O-antigen ligase